MSRKECARARREIALWLAGESDGVAADAHLRECPDCFAYRERLRALLGDVDSREKEVHSVLRDMDWDTLAKEVTRRAMRPQIFVKATRTRRRLPLAAALFGLGLLTGYLVFRHVPHAAMNTTAALQLSDSIRLVETAMDRREIVDFLGRGRLLLLELMHGSETDREREMLAGAAARLLQEYRYLGQNLDQSSIQEARGVMERFSWVLTELSYDPPPAKERIAAVRRMVERERLLLKVRLIERELGVPTHEV